MFTAFWEGAREGKAHLEYLDVRPCGKDDAVDAEDAKEDVVCWDFVESSAQSLPRSWGLPVSA